MEYPGTEIAIRPITGEKSEYPTVAQVFQLAAEANPIAQNVIQEVQRKLLGDGLVLSCKLCGSRDAGHSDIFIVFSRC